MEDPLCTSLNPENKSLATVLNNYLLWWLWPNGLRGNRLCSHLVSKNQSQNNRMIGLQRDHWRASGPTSLLKWVYLRQVAQDPVGPECLQKRRLHNLFWATCSRMSLFWQVLGIVASKRNLKKTQQNNKKVSLLPICTAESGPKKLNCVSRQITITALFCVWHDPWYFISGLCPNLLQ